MVSGFVPKENTCGERLTCAFFIKVVRYTNPNKHIIQKHADKIIVPVKDGG